VCDDEPRDVRDYNPEVPGWLVEIIDKLHAKRPRDRFRSAGQVARLLDRHLAHLRSPDTVEKPGPVGRPRRPAAHRWWPVVLVIPAVALVALAAWGMMYLLDPNRHGHLPTDPDGQAKQVELTSDPVPPVPVVRPPNPRAPAAKAPEPVEGGNDYFQKLWANVHVEDHFTRKDALARLADEGLVQSIPNDQRPKVARKLIELTKVDDVWIRWGAIKALGVWGSESEVPVLLAALGDHDLSTRREALKVVGRFRDDRILVPVIQCFREFSTRGEASQALRQIGPRAEPHVLAILNEPDELALLSLKHDAILVLADIGTEASVPALRKVLASENIHHRRLKEPAQKALAAIDGRKKP
jgi:HEAT repeat protein